MREAVALVARELMEAEVSAEVGAELGEVGPEARSTYRNGYRPRLWETRVGEIELLVPGKRQGPACFPSFLEPRRRSEQAIVAVVLEAYVNGVSTRKVDRLVEQLGIGAMTKDASRRCVANLDEQVDLFRGRPSRTRTPCLWPDAKLVKVRDHGRVVSKALVVAYAVQVVFDWFAAADDYLFTVPMSNHSVPWVLKHLIDTISQPGMVFGFDPQTGYSGLLEDKRAVVIYTGAVYYEGAGLAFGRDFHRTYFNDWLRWAGIDDVAEVRFQPNLVTGDAAGARAAALTQARELAHRLARTEMSALG